MMNQAPPGNWTVLHENDELFLSNMQAALSYADGLILNRPLVKFIDLERKLIRLVKAESIHFEYDDDDESLQEAS